MQTAPKPTAAELAAITPPTLLMIPGPTPVTEDVLLAGARPILGHGDPLFRVLVAENMAFLRAMFGAPSAVPLMVGGSGTLAMEIALVNLIEPGDRILVLETGVFGRRFAEIARRNGAEVRIEAAPLGQALDLETVRRALAAYKPKVMTMTHVDTSTGVKVDVPALSRAAAEQGALVIVDGVCSIGGEEFRGDEWGVDVGLTASQKALGAPPGLGIVTVGPRARSVRAARTAPFTGYFTDWNNWIPVMESYEGTTPAYFGTPPVTVLASLNAALNAAAREGLPARFARHARNSRAFKAGLAALGLESVAGPEVQANTLTVARLPTGSADALVNAVAEEGVSIAQAIHPELRGTAFRVGHMGAAGTSEILIALAAIERGLRRIGQPIELGAGLAAAQRELV